LSFGGCMGVLMARRDIFDFHSTGRQNRKGTGCANPAPQVVDGLELMKKVHPAIHPVNQFRDSLQTLSEFGRGNSRNSPESASCHI